MSVPRLITTLLVLVFSAWIVWFFATNPRLEWNVVGHYLFDRQVLAGLRTTLVISCISQAIGMVLGVLFASFRLSPLVSLRLVGAAYVTIFRSIPTMVQLIFWFDIAYLIPNLSITLPFGIGPHYGHWSTNSIVTPWIAGVLALSLVQGAYMTEITRAGILSVGIGQHDAARSLGYTSGQTFWRVVLPQAVRVIIPPTGSQFITVVHGSALISVISVSDLLFSVTNIFQKNYKIVPLLLVAVIWYLIVVLILTYFQQQLERRYSRGHKRAAGPRRRLTARWAR
jgi:polar amino acid transport system permease protein